MRAGTAGAALALVLLAGCALRTETGAGMTATAPLAAGPEDAGGVLWRVGPSAIDLARYYPAGAREQDVSGRAELSCQLKAGRPTSCVVVSEDPPGMGFGMAALRASANLVAAPNNRAGVAQEGETVRMPFVWSATP